MVRIHLGSPLFSKEDRTALLFPSSSGLGHLPFTEDTGVQIPLGTPTSLKKSQKKIKPQKSKTRRNKKTLRNILTPKLLKRSWRSHRAFGLKSEGFIRRQEPEEGVAKRSPEGMRPRWPNPIPLAPASESKAIASLPQTQLTHPIANNHHQAYPHLMRKLFTESIKKIPPPLLHIATFVLAAELFSKFDSMNVPAPLIEPLRDLGYLFCLGALTLMLPSLAKFLIRKTTLIPHKQSAVLITSFPYQWTRNPMYLGLTLGSSGFAIIMNLPLALTLLPLPWLAMDRIIIPMEEEQLTSNFGESYKLYTSQVRRWIGCKR